MFEEEEKSSFDRKSIILFLSVYKVPLILGAIGIIFFASAIILKIKDIESDKSIVFDTVSSKSADLKIAVDVEGAVMTPGVYHLPQDSRIMDALSLAGGLSGGADREWLSKNLNKAAKLIDGSKIYIPDTSETSSSTLGLPAGKAGNLSNVAGITTGTVNINSASQSDLESLPGVGPVTAGKIISGRPYQSIEELKLKKVIGTALFEKLKDLLTVY